MKTENSAEILRKYHIRVTRIAESVLEILQENQHPITVEEIFLYLHEKGNEGNISTVYRTIERFMEKGLVYKHAYMAEGKSLYELTGEAHHHYFRCLGCGKLLAVDTCPVDDFVRELSKRLHVEVTGHKLELSGYCEECRG